MRQPFWIVNSTLLIIALATAGFIYFSQPSLPERNPIKPLRPSSHTTKQSASFNIDKIYEYDLFDTYQKELNPVAPADYVALAPDAPRPMGISIPEEPKPQFIEPLSITLKGIVVIRNDDTRNRAVIMDNKTNKETSYKVGDMIEDAQLIRIFSNKIILVRSNGQQEVLYLRERDAKIDPLYSTIDGWDKIIVPAGPTTYSIYAAEFVERVPSLGQFIDLLEVTTAYSQGQSIGCRVNLVGPGTLATALGFSKEDIITAVNGISTAHTSNRLAIYNTVVAAQTNDIITVTLQRNYQEIIYTYTILETQRIQKQEIGNPPPSEAISQKKQLETTQTFAPTLQELRSREKSNILQKGKRPTQNLLSNLTE